MSWRCRPITWSPMSGRPGFSAGSLACCMRRSAAGSPIRCRRCGCSTPISLSGSGRGWPGRCWRGSWGTGGLSWPGPRCRPAVRSSAGAAARFAVPAETAAGLRALARENGVTMFMTLFAAYAVLLGRYAGLEDVVAGTPVANRNSAETEGLIGFFVNTLVLRADLAGDPPFTELLGRVRAMALGAYAHQDVPFEQLVDALVTDRDRSRTPLFQALFNYDAGDGGGAGAGQDRDRGRDGDRERDRDRERERDRGRGRDAAGGGAAGAGAGGGGDAGLVLGDVRAAVVAKFDLRLVLARAGGGLAGELEYGTALFDRGSAERMAGQLVLLLGAVAADPGARLSGLPAVTAAERELLAEWNDTGSPAAAAGGVHELVAARAAACPGAAAVVCGGVSLSYGELEERAGRLAGYLAGAGVGAGTGVGVCLDRGPEMVAAVLAVWKAGGAYLPLDPGFPAGRLGFMLADSGAGVLVGTAAVLAELPAGRIRTVVLDDPAVAAALAAAPAAGAAPAGAAVAAAG